MNIIRASGPLAKFLDARARGASADELTALRAVVEKSQGEAPSPRGHTPKFTVIDGDRDRIARSWDSARP